MNKYLKALDDLTNDLSFPCSNCDFNNSNCAGCNIKKDISILKELVDKETPKKVKTATKEEYVETGYRNTCPNCGSYVGTKLQSYGVQYGIEENDYCCSCGQKLDWGNEDE